MRSAASDSISFTGATLVRQNYSMKWPSSAIVLVPAGENPTVRLAVCVAPLYMTANWLQLVKFVEVWRAHGAEKIIIYYQSVSASVMKFLRAYEAENLVIIVPWSLLPIDEKTKFDPNTHLFRIGQHMAEHDCIYRTAKLAKYVAKVDLDEFIIPHSGTVLWLYHTANILTNYSALAKILKSNFYSGNNRYIELLQSLPIVTELQIFSGTLIDFLEQRLQKRSNTGVFLFQQRPLVFAKNPLPQKRNNWVNLNEIDFTFMSSSVYEDDKVKKKSKRHHLEKTIILPQRIANVSVHDAETLKSFEKVSYPKIY
jgi:hypothetical protein